MSGQGNGLALGQFADTGSVEHRPGPPHDNTNFAGQDPHVLYDQVQNADPAQVSRVADSWNKIGEALDTVGDVLATGVARGAAGWTGAAAQSALGFHTRVAQWTAVAAQASHQAGDNVSMQSDAASNAKYSMPKPINYGMPQALADFAGNPLNIGEIQQKLDQAQQNGEQIRQIARQYDTSLVQASQRMPALGPTPTFGGPGSGSPTPPPMLPPAGGGPGGAGSAPQTVQGDSAGGTVVASRDGGAGASFSSPVGVPGTPPGSAGGPGSIVPPPLLHTTPQDAGGPFGGSGGPGSGSPMGTAPLPGSPAAPDGGMGFVPGGPMGAGGGVGGGDPAIGRFGGAAGSAGRFGGRGGTSGGRSAVGSGGRSAAGAVPAAEDAFEERAATGAPGQAGFGGMGAGRGRGSEDEEHRRPAYLVENDPDSIFGTGERTAPPVIGE